MPVSILRVNDFEKQELKEHIREVQKLAAAMGKRVDLRRPVSSKELYSDKKTTLESTLSLAGLLHDFGNHLHEIWLYNRSSYESSSPHFFYSLLSF